MANDATIRRVARPRGELTEGQASWLKMAQDELDAWRGEYRARVVQVLAEGASFAEVSKATGLSTNTLQRWKREAND